MRPRTNQIIPFPLREVLEKETHGALFREVMDHVEKVATFVDGPGRRIAKAASLKSSLAYSRASLVLTTKLVDASSLMILARDWVDDKVPDDDAITRLGRLRLGGAERFWDDENTPEEMQQLCLVAEALLARVRSAAERLRRAVEAEQGREVA